MNDELLLLDLIMRRITQVLSIGCLFAAVYFFSYNMPWARNLSQTLNKWHSTSGLSSYFEAWINADAHIIKLRKLLSVIALLFGLILSYLVFRY